MKAENGVKFTTIIHEDRIRMGLSLEDYCIADYIYNIASNPSSTTPGWCHASKDTIAKFFCISRATVYRCISKLIEQGYIERSEKDNSLLKTTSKWFDTVVIRPSQNETDSLKMRRVPSQNETWNRLKMRHHNNIYNNTYIKDLKEKYRTLGNSDSEVRQKIQIEKEINRLQT